VSGGMDLNKLLEQAQQMQAQVQKAQEEIQNETVEGTAGGGAVKVTATGAGKITAIEIAKEAIDPDDPEGLADLVLAAVNNALENAETLAKSKLNLGALGDLGSLGLGF
jgi:DNA-binding YbaB/EbfC family protein